MRTSVVIVNLRRAVSYPLSMPYTDENKAITTTISNDNILTPFLSLAENIIDVVCNKLCTNFLVADIEKTLRPVENIMVWV